MFTNKLDQINYWIHINAHLLLLFFRTVLRKTQHIWKKKQQQQYSSIYFTIRFLFQLIFIQWAATYCELASNNVSLLRNKFLCWVCNMNDSLWMTIKNKMFRKKMVETAKTATAFGFKSARNENRQKNWIAGQRLVLFLTRCKHWTTLVNMRTWYGIWFDRMSHI